MTIPPTDQSDRWSSSGRAFELLAESNLPATLSTFRVRESQISCSAGRVLWAIEPNGSRHLLVPTAATFHADTRSAGVQIAPLALHGAPGDVLYADVRCALPHLRAVFAVLADEMLGAVMERPTDALAAIQQILDRWRELLEPERTTLLGPQQLAGLLAELLALEDVWFCSGRATPTIWRGPLRQRHDISDDRVALEVKATTAREGFAVEIHGLEQLEAPAEGTLLLRAYRLEPSAAAGSDVPSVIRRLLDVCEDRTGLITLLAAAGYRVADEDAYAQFHFVLRDERTYLVSNDFPAITRGHFKDGILPSIREVRYVVDLGGASPAPLPTQDVRRHLAMIGGG